MDSGALNSDEGFTGRSVVVKRVCRDRIWHIHINRATVISVGSRPDDLS